MNDNVSPTATNDCVSPRAIMLALEINRQCDQLLAIIAGKLGTLPIFFTTQHSPPRAGCCFFPTDHHFPLKTGPTLPTPQLLTPRRPAAHLLTNNSRPLRATAIPPPERKYFAFSVYDSNIQP